MVVFSDCAGFCLDAMGGMTLHACPLYAAVRDGLQRCKVMKDI